MQLTDEFRTYDLSSGALRVLIQHLAFHELGHALAAVKNEIDFLYVQLGGSINPSTNEPLLGELRLSPRGHEQISTNDALAEALSVGGPASEFGLVRRQYVSVELADYVRFAYHGWFEDFQMLGQRQFRGRLSITNQDLVDYCQPLVDTESTSYTDAEIERVSKASVELVAAPQHRLYRDDVIKLLS